MSTDQILSKHKEQCQGAVTSFKRDLSKVRTGRASTGLVDAIQVEYYGSKAPLKQLAQISTPESRMILIQAYDAGAIPGIEKAIQNSGLGLNPSRDGNLVRVSIPPLNEQTRKEIVKQLNKIAEEVRVSIRNHRRDANEALKKLEKDDGLPKDDGKKAADRIQKQTDSFIDEVDKLFKAKEAEVLEV